MKYKGCKPNRKNARKILKYLAITVRLSGFKTRKELLDFTLFSDPNFYIISFNNNRVPNNLKHYTANSSGQISLF